jgi:signal transduction histidine kinase
MALESRVAVRTAEPTIADRQLTLLKDDLAAELSVMTRLHEFTIRLRRIAELPVVLEEALSAMIEIEQADFGNVQLYNPQSRTLAIATQRGLNADFLEYFAAVDAPDTVFGRPRECGSHIVIEDVQTDTQFAPHRRIALSAGFRAVHSMLLFSHRRELLGVISTHFKHPHRSTERDLRLTDLYGQQVAEIIERKRADDDHAKLLAVIGQLTHITRIMSMGELTTSIAHEISQPLTGIIANGYACIRAMKRDIPDLPAARACAENVMRDADRVNDVIRGIRALTRNAPTDKHALDVNTIICEVMCMVREQLRSSRIEITLALSEDAVCVMADQIQLQQAFLNLVVNAVEALDPLTDRPRRLRIWSRRDVGNLVTVGVEDEGIGLGAQAMERLFDSFFTTKAEGMGLGLSISRNIIQAHGGELIAARNDPHGTTMTFSLPAHDPHCCPA